MSEQRRSNVDGVAGVVLVLLILFAVVAGIGGLFYTRTVRAKQQTLVAMERALAAEEMARAAQMQAQQVAAQRQQAEVIAEVEPQPSILISLDAEGHLSLDGQAVESEALQRTIRESAGRTFVLQVDKACRFEHVSSVLVAFDGLHRPRPSLEMQ